MPKIRPAHAVVLVLALVGGLIGLAELQSGSSHHERVRAGRDGVVRLAVAKLPRNQVAFYRYLNSANQEVKFFVGRDERGGLQVAFDASENHYKLGRGFRFQDGWIVDNKCESSFRLSSVNGGGQGCSPVPIPFQVAGEEILLREADLLAGWRYFV